MPNPLYKKILLTLLLTLAIFAVLFVLLNWGYIWQNLRYDFSRHPKITAATVTTAPKGQPNILSIASINITAPIVYATATTETVWQADLKNGVVHYPGTANPGQPGNCYIFGHSSDYIWSKGHYKTIFALLPKIAVGDKIVISDPQGNVFTYTVTGTKIVSPNDTQYLQQDLTKKTLTVQTSYPVGTALERFLVLAATN